MPCITRTVHIPKNLNIIIALPLKSFLHIHSFTSSVLSSDSHVRLLMRGVISTLYLSRCLWCTPPVPPFLSPPLAYKYLSHFHLFLTFIALNFCNFHGFSTTLLNKITNTTSNKSFNSPPTNPLQPILQPPILQTHPPPKIPKTSPLAKWGRQ